MNTKITILFAIVCLIGSSIAATHKKHHVAKRAENATTSDTPAIVQDVQKIVDDIADIINRQVDNLKKEYNSASLLTKPAIQTIKNCMETLAAIVNTASTNLSTMSDMILKESLKSVSSQLQDFVDIAIPMVERSIVVQSLKAAILTTLTEVKKRVDYLKTRLNE